MNRPEPETDTRFSAEEFRSSVLIAGVGSFHGDDQLGWQVIDRLEEELEGSHCCFKFASPHQLLDHLDGVRLLILCDAAATGDLPGTWRRLDWPNSKIPASTRTSTHSTDWNQLLGLACHLHPQLHGISFWILSGTNWQPGDSMATGATAALGEVVQDIRTYVKSIPYSEIKMSSPGSW